MLTNPVLGQGADPFVVFTDGQYHQVLSAGDGNGVVMRSATSLATLSTAPEQTIFTGGADGSPCCEWWAPEVHQVDGRWYVYVAADDGDNENHRTYVLSADTITGPYAFEGRLELPGDRWAIDATVFAVGDVSYVAWSGWPGDKNGEQDLYLARLSSPTKVAGKAVRHSRPELAWETHAGDVGCAGQRGSGRPGPRRAGVPDLLRLGLLDAGVRARHADRRRVGRPARPGLVDEVPGARVRAPEGSGLYGTGHNNFFTSPDGTQTWLVYHAVTTPEGSCGDDREVYAQPITFAADGTPQLGTPSAGDVPLPSGDPGR